MARGDGLATYILKKLRRRKIKAYVFSIGEKTTDLCCELMREYGFEVILFEDQTSLWEKLERFYTEALGSGDYKFVRIDADIIPNRNVLKLIGEFGAWDCAVGYDWYKQDRGSISIHVMRREVIETCLKHIEEAKDEIRPETYLWRLPEINSLTRTIDKYSCGLHGYGQKDHRQRIKDLKYNRGQKYDWSLLDRIEAL